MLRFVLGAGEKERLSDPWTVFENSVNRRPHLGADRYGSLVTHFIGVGWPTD